MKRLLKNAFVALLGILSVAYLANPTLGLFELIPDNLPGIGNLDEAGATTLLLSALAYFGWDVSGFFRTMRPQRGVPTDQSRVR